MALPALTLTDQGRDQAGLDVVVALGDLYSEGVFLFGREVALAALVVDQAFLVDEDLVREAIASGNGEDWDAELVSYDGQHQRSTF